MSNKLNLVPNPILGYRIHPDQWNWTVVVVKRHGENSKNAGQEYETPLSYPRDIYGAISYITNHVAALEGDRLQQIAFDTTGVAADLDVLKVAFDTAKNAAISAVEDFEKRLKASGMDLSSLTKRSLDAAPQEEDEEQTGT